MTFRERFHKGNSQSHASNSFHTLTTTDCTATDALRKIYTGNSKLMATRHISPHVPEMKQPGTRDQGDVQ